MSEDTIFGKIIRGAAPATIVYEDEQCLAFHDLFPAAPTHILLIPRKPIPRLCDAQPEDQALLGHMLIVASKIAEQEGIRDKYRLVINNGADAGQTVFHLHMHIIGKRELSWPPG